MADRTGLRRVGGCVGTYRLPQVTVRLGTAQTAVLAGAASRGLSSPAR
jgi:hypothetical protein